MCRFSGDVRLPKTYASAIGFNWFGDCVHVRESQMLSEFDSDGGLSYGRLLCGWKRYGIYT